MKKILLSFLSLLCAFSLIISPAGADSGYGENFGDIEDTFIEKSNIGDYVSPVLKTDYQFIDSADEFGTVKASSEFIIEGVDVELQAIAAPNYRFVEWRTWEDLMFSTSETITHDFADGKQIYAVFETDMILDINFDDGTYANSQASRGSIVSEGDNKFMKFKAASAWAINKLKKSGVDVYSNTPYKPNTTYLLTVDYRVIDGGTNPSGIISFAPHKSFYNGGNSPQLLVSVSEDNYNKWFTYEVYFQTTDATGMGESYIADGLFQTCACYNYEIDVDNIRIFEAEPLSFEPAVNPVEEIKYPIVSEETEEYMILPAGTSAATAKMTYEDPENYNAYSGDTKLNALDFLSTGDTLSDADSQISLKVRGDFDGGGSTVTDILKCVDVIMNSSSDSLEKTLSDVDENGVTTVSDAVSIRKYSLGKGAQYIDKTLAKKETTTYNIRSYEDYIKINGRYRNTLCGVSFDYAAMGIKFTAYCEGDVKIKLSEISGAVFYTAYVNGVKDPVRLYATNNVVTIAEDLAPGYYEFEFLRQNDVDQSASIDAILLQGSLLPVTKGNSLKIEVIGDSITSGCGSVFLEQEQSMTIAINSDATLGYAYLTSRALGMDYFNFSRGARTLCEDAYESNGTKRECIASLYEYTNPWRTLTATEEYSFETSADIVVINLGTNDAMCSVTDAKFKEAMIAFIEKVESYNPNAKIVWAYGMMNANAYTSTIPETMEELGGAEAGYYSVKLPLDTGASGSVSTEPHFYSHPVVAGHAAAAEVLTEFIEDNVL